MNVVLPIILAWGAGVMTVLVFFMSIDDDNWEDVDDDIFEQDDQEDKDE